MTGKDERTSETPWRAYLIGLEADRNPGLRLKAQLGCQRARSEGKDLRYSPEHNETIRKRIVDIASLRFRRDGINAVGLAPLMQEAGLTHGTFYTHFKSKDDLVSATIAELNRERLHAISDTLKKPDGFEAFLRAYLSEGHRDTFAAGCLNASIVGEIARESDKVRAIYTEGTSALVDVLAACLERFSAAQRRPAAIALLAMICGGIQSARAVSDAASSKEILDSTFSMAMMFALGTEAAR
ncbi:TetR/AcrR family transcriptional regulator [Sphingobium sp. CR2-8]|uniref:TetR/AcrR family transcriptional regulator n=1 Tax=Sphingobium sp. CR2-8 TaxID=1306534 RepID=UPI002DBD7E33|nr:TetR/AcrR family transcriptional regulator [Sphingobium sp. CR2-8]MEC3909168.1 TetR/AcrR family transcriptional regulator [Sphingobium sp. CR2-8]